MVSPTQTARVGTPPLRKGIVPAVLTPTSESVTVSVEDPSTTADSVIVASAMVPVGADSDELELDPLDVCVGAITPGVGFDLIVTPGPRSAPSGTYRIPFIAW